jgi:hypothetical protein
MTYYHSLLLKLKFGVAAQSTLVLTAYVANKK